MFAHINSQVNEGKLLKYTYNGNLYIFDPLDVKIGTKYSEGSMVDIFDPVTNKVIATGEIIHKNSDNETARVDWSYLTDGMRPNSQEFISDVSLKALKIGN
jgi:hypothetical protein